jgi:hypothetical protein
MVCVNSSGVNAKPWAEPTSKGGLSMNIRQHLFAAKLVAAIPAAFAR